MAVNIMGTKKVEELLTSKSMPQGMQFFVPKYQRGYRWKESQVQQLLNDIKEFDYEKNNEKVFYCLQPLVVTEDKEKGWVVIDGQQRLTTLYIILTCIEKMLYKEKASLYQLNYQNKTQMHDWLEELGDVNREVVIDSGDIDAYHITNAYLTVQKWLGDANDLKAIGAEIREKIRTYTRFIWYEVKGNINPEIIFTNINMGKIKLTNAELIKALLLKQDNYKGEEEEVIKASQIKISTAWDNMEANLQREDLWRFLTGSGKFSNSETHMELIFKIMAKDIVKERIVNHPEFYIENEEQLNKDTYTFIIFNRELEYLEAENDSDKSYSEMLENFWGKIERYYNMFIDWYENREWYHLIGVLLAKEENQTETYFEELCDLYRSHTKSDFVRKLKDRIINEIDFEDKDKDDFEFDKDVVEEYLKSLVYSDKKADKDKIRNILLLFNIISMQNNTDSNPRFPFDSYQKQKWDIEHIHSVTTERAQNKKEREEWIESAWPYIEGVSVDPAASTMYACAKKIRDNKSYDDEHAAEYDDMYNAVIVFFAGEKGIDDAPINEISNLTLLDQKTNRGYRNHIFPVKRNKILEKSGVENFIPLCTKNVFLKFYSKTISQMYLWDKNDRKDYFEKMADEIFDYLSKVDEEE